MSPARRIDPRRRAAGDAGRWQLFARLRPSRAAVGSLAIAGLIAWAPGPVLSQVSGLPDELGAAVYVDEADAAVRAQLERARAQIQARQWTDAVETLLQVAGNNGGKLAPHGPWRYCSVGEHCQSLLAALPTAGLAEYRRRIDDEAEPAIAAARATGSVGRLRRAIEDYLCSTPADAGQMELAELAIEQGDYATAREALERLLPQPPSRVTLAAFEAARDAPSTSPTDKARLARRYRLDDQARPPHYRLQAADRPLDDDEARELAVFWREQNLGEGRPVYPDTRQELARVRALLVLISIHEGSIERATDELTAYQALHGAAEGVIEGAKVRYADRLKSLLVAAASWAPNRSPRGWPTFGGAWNRAAVGLPITDVGAAAWGPIALDPPAIDAASARLFRLGTAAIRPAEFPCYFPVVADNGLYWCNQHQVFAFDLPTGRPRYQRDPAVRPGLVFEFSHGAGRGPQAVGLPRYTLSVHDGRLYARLGGATTSRVPAAAVDRPSQIVCLDLASAKTLWDLLPDDDAWAFESEPSVDGDFLYVAMRRSDVRPQLYVACFEQPWISSANRRPPRLRWRTLIGSAETAASGLYDEVTHQLLTLHEGVIYCNTNLGVIGAVDAESGRLRWATRYPRVNRIAPGAADRAAPLLVRDLGPCLASGGRLYCAPSDSAAALALRETTGELLWRSELPSDATYLLGVNRESLWVGGDQLRWIDVESGQLRAVWPDQPRGAEVLRGHGRGVLAGDRILWPTREAIYVFFQRLGPSREPRMARQPVSLAALRGASGGNLLVADGYLIVAASDRLYAFRAIGGDAAAPSGRSAAAAGSP